MRSCHSRCCSLLSNRSCWLHLCILLATFWTASSFAFLASLSGLVQGVQILGAPRALLLIDFSSITLFLCVSLGPWCSPLLLATSHPSQSRVHPTERYHTRDRSLWLFAAHVSSTMACLVLSRHPSLCSLTSALICAVLHLSSPPPAVCTREHASCAHRETTLCVSRESSVHHCLSLKAVLSSRLWDSTTAWSAGAFNTTGAVVVRGKTSCVPSLFLSPALLRGRPHACKRILPYGLLLNVARPPCLACDASTFC